MKYVKLENMPKMEFLKLDVFFPNFLSLSSGFSQQPLSLPDFPLSLLHWKLAGVMEARRAPEKASPSTGEPPAATAAAAAAHGTVASAGGSPMLGDAFSGAWRASITPARGQ